MKKVIFSTEETETFVNQLLTEQKYVIDVQELPDAAGWIVQWQEHKTYKALDGKEFPDEVWLTEDNRLFLVQDLEPEHCRNILRMMLRNERELKERFAQLSDHLVEIVQQGGLIESDAEEVQHTLH
jgi:hypothetical protein